MPDNIELCGSNAFPTGVGMNRPSRSRSSPSRSVPHGRGDEPESVEWHRISFYAFPTGVGMNRLAAFYPLLRGGVPHGRGDEPAVLHLPYVTRTRSPRAWG